MFQSQAQTGHTSEPCPQVPPYWIMKGVRAGVLSQYMWSGFAPYQQKIGRHTYHIVRLLSLQLYYPVEVSGHLESTWGLEMADGF